MEPLLQISHLTKIFSDGKEDEYKAVDDVSFELFPGEKLAIIGESGSGKTTVVNMITRILDSTDGKILLDGEDITHYKRNKMKNIYRKMQMVFQTPTESFDPRCRLGDAVAESLRNAGMPKKEAMEIVKELFKQCGLPEDFMKRYPHEVSGGQCQRAAIARAIAIKPRLLILDEATSALDVTVQAEILQLLDALQEERQMSYLFICHDIALIEQCAHQIAVMYLGNVVEVLPGGQLSKDAVHPYTRALMGSVFDINMDFSKPIENLEGEAPSPLELPEGCPFQGRCTKCMAICKKEAPQMVSLTPDHQVACHLYTESAQK